MTANPLYFVDPNELPRYSVAEAARYLELPATTLRSWVAGRRYPVASGQKNWAGLIERPDAVDSRLSFSNLIEAHVLKALRRQYQVGMKEVHKALDYAREDLGVGRVLLSRELRMTKGNVFLEYLGQLLNLGRGGQAAMPEILAAFLERVEWGRGALRCGFLLRPVPMSPRRRKSSRSIPRSPSVATSFLGIRNSFLLRASEVAGVRISVRAVATTLADVRISVRGNGTESLESQISIRPSATGIVAA